MDPDKAVSGGLLGATGPVQVTFGPCYFDYFDYTDKTGKVSARTVAALVNMSPEGEVDENGNQKTYQQMFSIGDPKSHHPNPDKFSFEGPLVKGSNFNFFLENLINAGFPKHLLAPGDSRALNGVVAVVEQKQPVKRNIPGATDPNQANKAQVVPVKIIHPAPGEAWSPTGMAYPSALGLTGVPTGAAASTQAAGPVSAPKGPPKQAAGPKKPIGSAAAKPAPTPAPAADDSQVLSLAENVVIGLIAGGGETGYSAKDAQGSLTKIGKDGTFFYMKKMQADAANYPPNARAAVIKMVQSEEFLAAAERPWAYDAESGLIVAG
jgi:hypothetical protein